MLDLVGIDFDPRPHWERTAEYKMRAQWAFYGKETQMPPVQPTGISKIWAFFKSSFTDRPSDKGTGLTAFKAEWDDLPENDKADIRKGVENGSLTY